VARRQAELVPRVGGRTLFVEADGGRLLRPLRACAGRRDRRCGGGVAVEDLIQVQDQFYILATASRAGERSAVLQHNDTFAVFDPYGDIGSLGTGEQGLYHEGTRYLSRFRLRLNDRRPLLLSSRVKDDNEPFCADLTNPDVPLAEPGQVLT